MFRFGDPGGRMYGSAGTNAANILTNWTSIPAGLFSSWSVSAGNGRNGGSSLRVNNNASNRALLKTLNSSVATLGVALGYRCSGTSSSGGGILTLADAGSVQVDLRHKADGTLQLTRNGTVLATSSAVLATNAYYHIEAKVLIDPSVGTAEVRVDGVPVIGPLTGLNTRATANSTVNGIYLLSPISPAVDTLNIDFDDIIVWDTATTDANGFADIHDFIGDCGLVWLSPTGAGTTTQFTPDSGSNYARVNEATPDGDTSYVESSTVGNIDTYAMADLAGTIATVKSLAAIHYARRTDTGFRGVKAELRSGGGNTAHATEIALGNSYQYYFSNFGQDPNNGSPTNWTVSAVNALESGQTVSS